MFDFIAKTSEHQQHENTSIAILLFVRKGHHPLYSGIYVLSFLSIQKERRNLYLSELSLSRIFSHPGVYASIIPQVCQEKIMSLRRILLTPCHSIVSFHTQGKERNLAKFCKSMLTKSTTFIMLAKELSAEVRHKSLVFAKNPGSEMRG